MNTNELLQKLKVWRTKTANLEGVEHFRVFANKVLENIAELKPSNKAELMAIKGIRDRKYAKYGEEILAIINNNNAETQADSVNIESNEPLSVSTYLDFLNRQLSQYRARVQGEISSVDIRARVVYFSLKDAEDESVINCLIWKRDYELNGIEFEVGMEVIAEGYPDVYKPAGKLSFKTQLVELVGEGALKKAYDQLRKKLAAEGLFLEERKRAIPAFPQKIGLITSETGAVIHDFLTNLGRYGFTINFINSRVEGKQAIRDLISAIDHFSDKDIEVLVIIRGGGSLESLQAFNNEALVKKIAGFHKPVICGIGHEKDIPLASLVADKSVSTPTATAHVLNKSWQEAASQIQFNSHKMLSIFRQEIASRKAFVQRSFHAMRDELQAIFDNFHKAELAFFQAVISIRSRISELNRKFTEYPRVFGKSMQELIYKTKIHLSTALAFPASQFSHSLGSVKQTVLYVEKTLERENPEKQLKMGYSIARLRGKVVHQVEQVKKGDIVEVMVQDGTFESNVSDIKKMR